jgi:hypothetical protein
LDNQNAVFLQWQNIGDEFIFEVTAKTKGYVGVGFSPNGGMQVCFS